MSVKYVLPVLCRSAVLRLFCCVGLTVLITPTLSTAQDAELFRGRFAKEITRTVDLEYLINLPPNYDRSTDEFPIMIYLHGGGAAGQGLEHLEDLVKRRVLPFTNKLPIVLLAPVLPNKGTWQPDDLIALLDQVSADYRIDQDRIYLVGFSRGGNGAWKFGADYGDRFAAVVPISGLGVHNVCRIKPAAVWIFHGTEDNVVITESSEAMKRALDRCEADVRLTLYPGVGHGAEAPTFQNPEFWEWLLLQQRK